MVGDGTFFRNYNSSGTWVNNEAFVPGPTPRRGNVEALTSYNLILNPSFAVDKQMFNQ
jgi:hypothetical protein